MHDHKIIPDVANKLARCSLSSRYLRRQTGTVCPKWLRNTCIYSLLALAVIERAFTATT